MPSKGVKFGLSGTDEWYVTSRVAWKLRRWIYRYGIKQEEFAHDLLPYAIEAARDFDPSKGRSKVSHMWTFAWWTALRLLDRQEQIKRRRERFYIPPRDNCPAADHDLQQQEIVQLAMCSITSPRDREIVTAVMSGQTLAQVGARHRITRERVRQIALRGLRQAREALRKEAVRVGSCLDECWR
jgi:DNA-directed RNA polymerase specialized sigma24 family protein